MSSLHEIATKIVLELTLLQDGSQPYHEEGDPFLFPRLIASGTGGSLRVSRKMDDQVLEFADKLFADNSALQAMATRKEWRSLVRRAFGPPLARIDLDDPVEGNATTVCEEVQTYLDDIAKQQGTVEHGFGCTFVSTRRDLFEVGPVRFERREDWLKRKFEEGAVSGVSRRRIERHWAGEKVRKRKLSEDSIVENRLIDVVGDAPSVCSIKTVGFAASAGREKALVAARLALTAVSLMWRQPSNALDRLNLSVDRIPRRKVSIEFISERIALASYWSPTPGEPRLGDGEWEQLFPADDPYLVCLGNILDHIVDSRRSGTGRDMQSTLAQALLWFHEGCRETMTWMAIVKFSAALDALACGGRLEGIRSLVTARLGIKANAPIREGGPSMKSATKKIYIDGRNPTVHGNNPKFLHDATDTRELSESFARHCLITCMDWVGRHPQCDDPKALSR